uniref:Uncharacterized protein n=1 Tax=Arundo donax TaxID=35708 RepID=A0A0A9BJS4_ARUDO
MCFTTILYSSGYLWSSSSSAEIRQSYYSRHMSLYHPYMIRRKWAYGRPLLWNSTTYT